MHPPVRLVESLIALSMGVLNVLNTLLMAVQERTREIGIVAAIGWSDARIVGLILIEGALIPVSLLILACKPRRGSGRSAQLSWSVSGLRWGNA